MKSLENMTFLYDVAVEGTREWWPQEIKGAVICLCKKACKLRRDTDTLMASVAL
jgi:hypothetical protein